MKRNKIILIFPILILALLVGCSDDDDDDKNEDDCISSQIVYVTSVDSPTKGMVNEKINIEVNFQVYNGCGNFGKFIETKNNDTLNIEVEAKYEGCICTQKMPIRTVNYEFIPNKAGHYILNFKTSKTEFITINLAIN